MLIEFSWGALGRKSGRKEFRLRRLGVSASWRFNFDEAAAALRSATRFGHPGTRCQPGRSVGSAGNGTWIDARSTMGRAIGIALVGALALDPDASIGGDGVTGSVCTAAITVRIDAACRVHATLADGSVIVDDAEPFDVADVARLVRTAPHDHVYGLGERTGGL